MSQHITCLKSETPEGEGGGVSGAQCGVVAQGLSAAARGSGIREDAPNVHTALRQLCRPMHTRKHTRKQKPRCCLLSPCSPAGSCSAPAGRCSVAASSLPSGRGAVSLTPAHGNLGGSLARCWCMDPRVLTAYGMLLHRQGSGTFPTVNTYRAFEEKEEEI